jgi:hypothetical protein
MPPPAIRQLKQARPVVAAGGVVDARGAAEFAEDDDQGLLQHAVGLEVGEQRGDAGVHGRAVGAHGLEDVAVVVEAAAVHLHEAHALFHQPAGEQAPRPNSVLP